MPSESEPEPENEIAWAVSEGFGVMEFIEAVGGVFDVDWNVNITASAQVYVVPAEDVILTLYEFPATIVNSPS